MAKQLYRGAGIFDIFRAVQGLIGPRTLNNNNTCDGPMSDDRVRRQKKERTTAEKKYLKYTHTQGRIISY